MLVALSRDNWDWHMGWIVGVPSGAAIKGEIDNDIFRKIAAAWTFAFGEDNFVDHATGPIVETPFGIEVPKC